jgi:hypothetical protein
MSRRDWWTALIGVSLVVIGFWEAWVPHRAAALVLSGWDLTEFVKFLPRISATRELFYLPVWCAALVLALIASQSTNRPSDGQQISWVWRLLMYLAALGLMFAILPPYPHTLIGFQSAEFRWRTILGVVGLVVVSGMLLVSLIQSSKASADTPADSSGSKRNQPSRTLGGLLLVLALVGALPALWQFLKIRSTIGTVYSTQLSWGWGLGFFFLGWVLVGASGVRLLSDRDGRRANHRSGQP